MTKNKLLLKNFANYVKLETNNLMQKLQFNAEVPFIYGIALQLLKDLLAKSQSIIEQVDTRLISTYLTLAFSTEDNP